MCVRSSYRLAATIMAAKGKRLVISLKNGFEDASPVNQKVGHPCPVPMDKIVQGMSGVKLQSWHSMLSPASGATLAVDF